MLRLIMLLKEPSTYAGIAGFLGAFGIYGLSPNDWATIIAVPMAIASAAAVVVSERKEPPRGEASRRVLDANR